MVQFGNKGEILAFEIELEFSVTLATPSSGLKMSYFCQIWLHAACINSPLKAYTFSPECNILCDTHESRDLFHRLFTFIYFKNLMNTYSYIFNYILSPKILPTISILILLTIIITTKILNNNRQKTNRYSRRGYSIIPRSEAKPMGSLRGNRLRRKTSRLLEQEELRLDQVAFNRWHSLSKTSKNSQQVDLPSSQIPSQMSILTPESPQLFAVVDTCSLVKFRREFMDYVTRLKQTFSDQRSPVRVIICVPVLEELDRCNRPRRFLKSETNQQDLNRQNVARTKETDMQEVINAAGNGGSGYRSSVENTNPDPPRMFMRFIEEEMRMKNILIGEFDPLKKIKMEINFEIINPDSRILECCLRTRAFINKHNHHKDTRVLLITEDNIFKAKATTYEVPSFRWLEFEPKYRNFGLANYVATPLIPVFKHASFKPNQQMVAQFGENVNGGSIFKIDETTIDLTTRINLHTTSTSEMEVTSQIGTSDSKVIKSEEEKIQRRQHYNNQEIGASLMKKICNNNAPIVTNPQKVLSNDLLSNLQLISENLSNMSEVGEKDNVNEDVPKIIKEIINL